MSPRPGVAKRQPGAGHGGDAVDLDVVAGQLLGDDLGERGDARLRRRRSCSARDWRADPDVDDVLTMLRGAGRPGLVLVAPVGGNVAGRAEVAAQVDADHVVPLALGHVDDEAVAQDAGVVDEDVDAAEGLDRRVDQRAGSFPVGDVAARRRSPLRRRRGSRRRPPRPGLLDRRPLPSLPPPVSLTTTRAPSRGEQQRMRRGRARGPLR